MIGFEKVIGHEKVKEYLSNIFSNSKLAHSYIFSGNKGLGKFKVAQIFAQNIQQDFKKEVSDCIVIDEEEKSIGVDLVRKKIIEDIYIAPFSKQWKIYIIKDAEKMTTQAQNALLKTLEEPPEHAIIILLVNDERMLLDTIKSRCITVKFVAPSKEETINYILQKYKISEEDASKIAGITYFNVGRTIQYCDLYLETDTWGKIIKVLRYLDNMYINEIISFIKELDKISTSLFFDTLCMHYRDMLNYKLSKDENVIIVTDLTDEVKKKSKVISYRSMYNCIESIIKAIERLKANANKITVLELLLLTIKENNNGNSDRG